MKFRMLRLADETAGACAALQSHLSHRFCASIRAGTVLWRSTLDAQVFAPIALLPAVPAEHQCRIPAPASGTTAQTVAVADQRGRLHVLCPSCGKAACPPVPLTAGEPGGGAAAATGVCSVPEMDTLLGRLHALQTGSYHEADSPGQLSVAMPAERDSGSIAQTVGTHAGPEAVPLRRGGAALPECGACRVAWCRNDGLVGMLRLPTGSQAGAVPETGVPVNMAVQRTEGGDAGISDVGAVQMPADTFSAPVAFGPFLVLGCRDDHLYCLRWR